MLVWNIILRTLQNGEADISLDGITWCKKQHSESVNNGVDIELFLCCQKKVSYVMCTAMDVFCKNVENK
jgi:hypothetical protein